MLDDRKLLAYLHAILLVLQKTRLAVVKQPYLHCNVMTLMYG